MTILLAIALVAAAGLAADRPEDGGECVARRANFRLLALAGVALVLSLVAYEALLFHAAEDQTPFPRWLVGARFVPILEVAPLYAHVPPRVALAALALAIVQTALLAAVAHGLRGAAAEPRVRRTIFAFAGALAAVALCARGLTSSDLYAYGFFAAHGYAAYRPLPILPGGPEDLVGRLWSFRMLPAAYGPVWLGLAHATAGAVRDPNARILALRVLAAGSFAGVLGALRSLRVPVAFLALVALDPAFVHQYVADGHNDLFAVALVLWAAVAARSGRLAFAIALAALAGASKASFLAIAALAFVEVPGVRRRLAAAAAAVAGGAALSLGLAGPAYPRALVTIAAIFPAAGEPGGALVPHVALAVCLALVAAALVARRTGWPGTWAFVSLGSIPFPWYLGWGLPYAALDPRRAMPFLVTFPLVAFALTTTFPATWAWPPLALALLAAAALLAYRRLRPLARSAGARVIAPARG